MAHSLDRPGRAVRPSKLLECDHGEVAGVLVLVFVLATSLFTLSDVRLSAANEGVRIPAFRRPTHTPADSKRFRAGGGALCVPLGVIASLVGLGLPTLLLLVLATMLPSLGVIITHNHRASRPVG